MALDYPAVDQDSGQIKIKLNILYYGGKVNGVGSFLAFGSCVSLIRTKFCSLRVLEPNHETPLWKPIMETHFWSLKIWFENAQDIPKCRANK